jgi:hypothetical protein
LLAFYNQFPTYINQVTSFKPVGLDLKTPSHYFKLRKGHSLCVAKVNNVASFVVTTQLNM